ncbi:protein S100-A13 isoform 1-T1 [Porphyrio hochstetteri]
MELQEANSSPVSWCDGYGVGTGCPRAGWSLLIPVERWTPGLLLCPGTMATGELTELETAIEKIVTVFFTHAGKEGKKGTLTAAEFKELVQLQLPNLMKDTTSLEEKMRELDVNSDEELKFGEYWRLVGELAKAVRREKAGKK